MVVIGLMVKGTRILVVDPPKSWLRVPQKVMPRNPDKLAYAKKGLLLRDEAHQSLASAYSNKL